MHLNRTKHASVEIFDHALAEEPEEPKKDLDEPKKESNGTTNAFSKRAQDLAEA